MVLGRKGIAKSMSEQTPETAADATTGEGFAASDAEPSMEDILASIRKIISDDGDPVALDGPTPITSEAPADTAVDTSLTSEAQVDAVQVESSVDEDDFDIAEMLGDLEAEMSEDMLSIPEIAPEAVEEEASAPIETTDAAPALDDMDQLMNDMLDDMDVAEVSEEPVVDLVQSETVPQSETITDADLSSPQDDAVSAAVDTDDEMDLVKTLMADLTDEDIAVDDIADDAQTADLVAEEPVEVPLDVLDAMEDDIFDSILDMTIENEVETFDAAQASGTVDASVPSLTDIADAAEAEAVIDTPQDDMSSPYAQTPAVESAALLGGQTLAASDEPVTVEKSESPHPDPAKLETPMPSALRSDAILDEVTEQATMGAFAQLSQVVEDKAVLSESGPRIGDLVQDALRPMLKDWLDENLQGIVERAVAKEVKRLSTGE